MTTSATTSAAATSLIKPMLLWLTIQLVALAIGAAGVPLSARRQIPPEFLAIDVMLVAQIVAAALLWPMLMADWRSAVGVIASALPFIQAAGFLSATPSADLWSAGGTAILWLITLAVLPRPKSHPTFMTGLRMAVVFWSIGGAIAMYLRAEFSVDDATLSIGPLSQALLRLHSHETPWFSAIFLLIFAIALRLAAAMSTKEK